MSRESWLAEGLKGRHVLMALIAFFGIMLIANGIFVYFAVATFSGGDTSNAYRKGLNYNETLAAAERQAARGWQTQLAYDDTAGRLLAQRTRQGGGAGHRAAVSTLRSAARRPTRRTGRLG